MECHINIGSSTPSSTYRKLWKGTCLHKLWSQSMQKSNVYICDVASHCYWCPSHWTTSHVIVCVPCYEVDQGKHHHYHVHMSCCTIISLDVHHTVPLVIIAHSFIHTLCQTMWHINVHVDLYYSTCSASNARYLKIGVVHYTK